MFVQESNEFVVLICSEGWWKLCLFKGVIMLGSSCNSSTSVSWSITSLSLQFEALVNGMPIFSTIVAEQCTSFGGI